MAPQRGEMAEGPPRLQAAPPEHPTTDGALSALRGQQAQGPSWPQAGSAGATGVTPMAPAQPNGVLSRATREESLLRGDQKLWAHADLRGDNRMGCEAMRIGLTPGALRPDDMPKSADEVWDAQVLVLPSSAAEMEDLLGEGAQGEGKAGADARAAAHGSGLFQGQYAAWGGAMPLPGQGWAGAMALPSEGVLEALSQAHLGEVSAFPKGLHSFGAEALMLEGGPALGEFPQEQSGVSRGETPDCSFDGLTTMMAGGMLLPPPPFNAMQMPPTPAAALWPTASSGPGPGVLGQGACAALPAAGGASTSLSSLSVAPAAAAGGFGAVDAAETGGGEGASGKAFQKGLHLMKTPGEAHEDAWGAAEGFHSLQGSRSTPRESLGGFTKAAGSQQQGGKDGVSKGAGERTEYVSSRLASIMMALEPQGPGASKHLTHHRQKQQQQQQLQEHGSGSVLNDVATGARHELASSHLQEYREDADIVPEEKHALPETPAASVRSASSAGLLQPRNSRSSNPGVEPLLRSQQTTQPTRSLQLLVERQQQGLPQSTGVHGNTPTAEGVSHATPPAFPVTEWAAVHVSHKQKRIPSAPEGETGGGRSPSASGGDSCRGSGGGGTDSGKMMPTGEGSWEGSGSRDRLAGGVSERGSLPWQAKGRRMSGECSSSRGTGTVAMECSQASRALQGAVGSCLSRGSNGSGSGSDPKSTSQGKSMATSLSKPSSSMASRTARYFATRLGIDAEALESMTGAAKEGGTTAEQGSKDSIELNLSEKSTGQRSMSSGEADEVKTPSQAEWGPPLSTFQVPASKLQCHPLTGLQSRGLSATPFPGEEDKPHGWSAATGGADKPNVAEAPHGPGSNPPGMRHCDVTPMPLRETSMALRGSAVSGKLPGQVCADHPAGGSAGASAERMPRGTQALGNKELHAPVQQGQNERRKHHTHFINDRATDKRHEQNDSQSAGARENVDHPCKEGPWEGDWTQGGEQGHGRPSLSRSQRQRLLPQAQGGLTLHAPEGQLGHIQLLAQPHPHPHPQPQPHPQPGLGLPVECAAERPSLAPSGKPPRDASRVSSIERVQAGRPLESVGVPGALGTPTSRALWVPGASGGLFLAQSNTVPLAPEAQASERLQEAPVALLPQGLGPYPGAPRAKAPAPSRSQAGRSLLQARGQAAMAGLLGMSLDLLGGEDEENDQEMGGRLGASTITRKWVLRRFLSPAHPGPTKPGSGTPTRARSTLSYILSAPPRTMAVDPSMLPPLPTDPALKARARTQMVALAEAYATDQPAQIRELSEELTAIASLDGCSTRKMVHHILRALSLRYTGNAELFGPKVTTTPSITQGSMDAFLAAVGWVPFSEIANTYALIHALRGHSRCHIVFLNEAGGVCWPAFFRAMADQPGGAPVVRVTSVNFFFIPEEANDGRTSLWGVRMHEAARAAGVPVAYRNLRVPCQDFQPSVVSIDPDEAVAVASCWSLFVLPDSSVLKSNPRNSMLKWFRSLSPKVLVLIESDNNFNSPFFLNRFQELLQRGAAIFEVLDAITPRGASCRPAMEFLFMQQVADCVACEGLNRFMRTERLEQWVERCRAVGFAPASLPVEAWEAFQTMSDADWSRQIIREGNVARLQWWGVPSLFASAWVVAA